MIVLLNQQAKSLAFMRLIFLVKLDKKQNKLYTYIHKYTYNTHINEK